jgi:hypothetical protein
MAAFMDTGRDPHAPALRWVGPLDSQPRAQVTTHGQNGTNSLRSGPEAGKERWGNGIHRRPEDDLNPIHDHNRICDRGPAIFPPGQGLATRRGAPARDLELASPTGAHELHAPHAPHSSHPPVAPPASDLMHSESNPEIARTPCHFIGSWPCSWAAKAVEPLFCDRRHARD